VGRAVDGGSRTRGGRDIGGRSPARADAGGVMRLGARAGSALPAEPAPAGNVLGRVVERVDSSGAGRSGALAERIARDNPDAGPADVIALLERRFRRRVSTVSALVGLTAAVPGVGTGVAAVLTAANLA